MTGLRYAILLFVVAGCGPGGGDTPEPATRDALREGARAAAANACEDAGLRLPEGFCATVFAESSGHLRHIAVSRSGTLYGMLSQPSEGHGLIAARDTVGDGRADEIRKFGDITGTGLLVHGDWLYGSSNTAVYRWRLPSPGLVPQGDPERVVGGFPEQRSHAAKSIAIGGEDLYVNVGAPSNACMEEARTPGSPGLDPCPQLDTTGGIWAFPANETGQEYAPERRYATGIRNAVALAWNAETDGLFVVQHGRDQLHGLFPELYDTADNAELPAEEMFAVEAGDDFGWPYCYYDPGRQRKVLAPEYGGDGEEAGRCAAADDPIAVYPAHWGPNALLFYRGGAFPERYHGGAFIAFHGSWNRAPEPQAGYNVVFQPFRQGRPSGNYEVFAEGFAGGGEILAPGDAQHRPTGLAVDGEGALYVADSLKGRIWRITWQGDALPAD